MATKVVRIDIDVLTDIDMLKFVLKKKYPSLVIRELMDRLGYDEAFFERMEEIRNRAPMRMQGDPPD